MPWQKRGFTRRRTLRRHIAAAGTIVLSMAVLAGCAMVVL
jgi:hypothetical protein